MKKRKNNAKKILIISIILMCVWILGFYVYITYSNIQVNPGEYETAKLQSTVQAQTVEEEEEKSENIANVIENTTKKVVGISKLKWSKTTGEVFSYLKDISFILIIKFQLLKL